MKQAIKKLFFKDHDIDYLFSRGILKGLKFRTNPMHKMQRIWGLDEREIEAVSRRYSAKAASAIDVGANDGWYTLFFAAQPGIKQIVACEPETQYQEAFHHNFAINPQVDKSKVKEVKAFIGNGTDAGLVAIDTLSASLEEPILLKIDVDGAENNVLESARETLTTRKTFVIIETHSPQLEKECERYLTSLGYTVTIVKNAWYRMFIKDLRPLEQNRWLYAEK